MAATNKWLLISESHGGLNRCTPCRGKPDQYATSHVVRVSNLSLVPTRTKQTPTPGRSLGDWRQTGPVIILGHLISPPSRQPWSRRERFQPSGYTAISAYWPISPACDRCVQYLLTSTNPSVLTQHRQRLPHRNLRIATTLSPPSPSECSTGPSNWPRPIFILSDINHRF
jgi:hypothetical protein